MYVYVCRCNKSDSGGNNEEDENIWMIMAMILMMVVVVIMMVIADIYIFDKYGNFWTSKYILWDDDGNN